MFDNQKWSCQHEWFKKYSWLFYDVASDSVTCYFCMHQKLAVEFENWTIEKEYILRKVFR